MTEQELNEIKERANQTWPGPWEWDENGYLRSTSADTDVPFGEVKEFVARARTDIPRLVSEVERLRAENAELRAYIADAMKDR
jgi:hypothetical protein